VGRVEMAANVFLGDAIEADVLALQLGGEPAEGVDQLGAAAVVEREGEGGSGAVGGGLLSPLHLVLDLGGELVGAADVAHSDVVIEHALDVVLEVAAEQAHEEVDFGAGPAEFVFQGKCVESKPGKADAGGSLGDILHTLGALQVAEESLERAAARPAAITVHDDGNVIGQALGLERGVEDTLLRAEVEDALCASKIQGSRLYSARAVQGPAA